MVASLTVALALCGSAATSSATQPSGRPAPGNALTQVSEPAPSRSAMPASSPDLAAMEDAYASREASAKNLQDFRGGDVVIVGTTGLVIVLIIILIILTI